MHSQEEVTPCISKHLHSNTILLNVTYFIGSQQQNQLEKDVSDKQTIDEARDKSY